MSLILAAGHTYQHHSIILERLSFSCRCSVFRRSAESETKSLVIGDSTGAQRRTIWGNYRAIKEFSTDWRKFFRPKAQSPKPRASWRAINAIKFNFNKLLLNYATFAGAVQTQKSWKIVKIIITFPALPPGLTFLFVLQSNCHNNNSNLRLKYYGEWWMTRSWTLTDGRRSCHRQHGVYVIIKIVIHSSRQSQSQSQTQSQILLTEKGY